MRDEKPFTEDEFREMLNANISDRCVSYFSKEFVNSRPCNYIFKFLEAEDIKYLYNNGMPNWNKIHGRARKDIKFEIKKAKKKTLEVYNLWNKYAGREDVLYIHARLGSTSWSDIRHYQYANKPWYLDSIDDSYDTSYCDIYAKIDPETIKNIKENEGE